MLRNTARCVLLVREWIGLVGKEGQADIKPLKSNEQLPDRAAPGHKLKRPGEPVAQFEVGGNAQAVVDGGDDVGGGDRVAAGPAADLVARPIHEAALEAAPGEHQA